MVVKSIKATDYSTGTEYTYGDTSGSWQSIKSNGGSINSNGNGGGSSAMASAPSVTEVSSGAPSPFGGTHRDTSSTFSTPSVWPWVPSPTTLQTSVSQTSIPGLPSGWTVSASGKVVPPSAAPVSEPPPFLVSHIRYSSANISVLAVNTPTRLFSLAYSCLASALILGSGRWF